ncbi:MAG: NAD(P)H-hydrate dehydratase [Cyanobacteriota bacterium]|nr:NAD(P)H-hydrate dehydratase [Cyanobacteriota bacterium]
MKPELNRREKIDRIVVSAAQMAAIEDMVFEAGMPVAALMEKVAGAIARRICTLYPQPIRVGVLVGPGHNGGDGLVVARELHFRGYPVSVYRPLPKSKPLTEQHARYVQSLGIEMSDRPEGLLACDLLIDGLFGFGLERAIEGEIAETIDRIARSSIPVVSIDLPSGLQTDTGAVLGTAVRATRTLCLGLWKLAFLQDRALEYLGEVELIDFDLPLSNIEAVLGKSPQTQRLTADCVRAALPLPRPPRTHKYDRGHLLLVCGSRRYGGAAILAGLGARASGVGMLSIAVPESLKPILTARLPEALIIGCPETATGAIERLSDEIEVDGYDAIACGPGLTPDAIRAVEAVWGARSPIVLDADGLNILVRLGTFLPKEPPLLLAGASGLRAAQTVFTPHPGEFRRLFPNLVEHLENTPIAARLAAQQSGAIVALKGARAAVAHPDGTVWLNPESTPALARGGTGDVLTGLTGGLIAQRATQHDAIASVVGAAVWWHARAGILAALERSELGVDAFTLTEYLGRAI